ncbi:hypothetical protein ADM96_35315 [Burkholderia sp. ST111]|nr:hypothetical protein ADM96_35315 [Burkholderia sp. ST111]
MVLCINAVDAALINGLLTLSKQRLEKALVSGKDGGIDSDGRRCEIAWISHDEDRHVQSVVNTMADLAKIENCRAERLQVTRYAEGGEYRPHYDSYDLVTERGCRCTGKRGQRIRTALLYLNDNFSGGETKFPRVGLDVIPKRGAVLVFDNCEVGCTQRDDKSLHAGAPVERGEKWIATLWFRER